MEHVEFSGRFGGRATRFFWHTASTAVMRFRGRPNLALRVTASTAFAHVDAAHPSEDSMFNIKYAGLFIYFGIALVALFNAATAIKTRSWTGFGRDLQGYPALIAGGVFLLVGVTALVQLGRLVQVAFTG